MKIKREGSNFIFFGELNFNDVFENDNKTIFMKIASVHIMGKGEVNALCLQTGNFTKFPANKIVHKFPEVELVIKG